MDADRRYLITVAAFNVLGLGLIVWGVALLADGKEIPPQLWTLLGTIVGGLTAYVTAMTMRRGDGPKDR